MKFLRSPRQSTHWVWEQPPLAPECPAKRAESEKPHEPQSAYNHRIRRPERRDQALPNGAAVTKFSVATTRSWKDDNGEWKAKTQWHNVLAFGPSFAQMAPRLTKGTHVFVQGELSTREYDRTISIPNGKKSIEHVIQQLAVELKADTIRILDRSASSENGEVIQQAADEDVPL